ncbi:MAG: hypothetical protein K9I85_05005 [Saprospiraceae bacterium]|nr:hypothetical protein [Saprospiraceae bacterium]
MTPSIHTRIASLCLLLGLIACRPEGLDATWQERSTGTTLDLFGLRFDQDGNGFAVGGKTWYAGTILRTNDAGQQWTEDRTDQKALLDLTAVDEGHWLATGVDGHLWQQSGSGDWLLRQMPEWRVNRAVLGLPGGDILIGGGQSFQFGFLYRVHPDNTISYLLETDNLINDLARCDDHRLIAAGYGAVFLSEDGAQTWSYLDITGDHFMAIEMVDGQIGYMVGYGGTILKTTDGWRTWMYVRNGDSLSVSNTPFRALAFMDSARGVLVGDAGTVWVTRDGGEHWDKLLGIPSSIDLTAVAIHQSEIFVAGTGGHLYQTPFP